ncbi:MAG: primosomal protein N' [Burkholderiales bacterium]|jgi:primosomal protein N' (replication factor Y)|nr:primosomal protein N' [Burkholderiales bacterium]
MSVPPSAAPPPSDWPETPTIAHVALPVAVPQTFDYRILPAQTVLPGSLVQVSLTGRKHVGVVTGVSTHSEIDAARLLSLETGYPQPPLPGDIRRLAAFVSDYYQSPLGLACSLAVPPLSAQPTPPKTVAEPLALTDAGREQLDIQFKQLGKRPAPAWRALWEIVQNGNAISIAQQQACSTAQKKYLRDWRAVGWLVPVRAVSAQIHTPSPLERESVPKGRERGKKHGAVLKDICPTLSSPVETTVFPPLHAEQRAAANAIEAALGSFQPFLLQGITGSGKTEVYLTLAGDIVAHGGQVLILLPEIHLTPQFLARIHTRLPGVDTALLHSSLPDGERLYHWQRAAEGRARLVLGTRLAVFTPLPNLALIIVDEEHDPSFKQQDNVRYHARDLAVWRARVRQVPIVLGSATPSLESYHHAQNDRYRHLHIRQRADPQATLPKLVLTPASHDAADHQGIAPVLWEAIGARLTRYEQSLIFINRRGFSPSLKCNACTWEAQCPHCAVRLVLHTQPLRLRCHHCGHTQRVPERCPSCGNLDLLPRGHGTQRLEAALAQAFPNARIARIDRDSTRRRHAFGSLHRQIADRQIDILIGTQMLAKGHDFPRVTLVGVLGADNALYSADFRATERLAALLHQVAGRAGRSALAGEVIVQTDFPNHPLYETLVRHDYDGFARVLLDERRAAHLPPFSALALLAAEARDDHLLNTFLRDAHQQALELDNPAVRVYPPSPAALARRAGYNRAQMVIQSHDRRTLQHFLTMWQPTLAALRTKHVRWTIDVDPLQI